MKRTITVLALATLALTGCAAQPARTAMDEKSFFDLARDIDGVSTLDNKDLSALGKGTCAILESDPNTGYVQNVKNLTDAGLSAHDAGYIITLSAATYCPDMVASLPKA